MNAHVAAPVQPLDQHFQTIGSELVPELRSLNVIMAEVRCSMVLARTAPVRMLNHRKDPKKEH